MARLVLATSRGCYLKLTPDGRIVFVLDAKMLLCIGLYVGYQERNRTGMSAKTQFTCGEMFSILSCFLLPTKSHMQKATDS